MQELQAQFDEDAISVELASPSDARALAKLYASVYRGIYPNPELFTIAGMAEFLDFSKSRAYTMKVTCQQEVVAGCTFQLHKRAAYCRGFMVAPQWQGRIRAKQVFDRLLLDAREVLKGKADYFYGELRTEAAKVQSIAEGVGMRPFALLPRKDIFHGKRESEVIYAWFCTQPVIRPLMMTRASARMASVVLGGMVPCFDPPADQIEPEVGAGNLSATYHVFSLGEGRFTVSIAGGRLESSICPISREAERVIIHAPDAVTYRTLVRAFLGEMRLRTIEYAEIYAEASAIEHQAVLESLGFAPTGFLPAWYAPGSKAPHDCVVYTISFPSALPDCPLALTAEGEFLREFLTTPRPFASLIRTHGTITA